MNDLIEVGYNPPTELKDNFAESGYPNSDTSASIHFYKSENCSTPELQRAIKATVFLTDGKEQGGSGVIISSGEKRYLVTSHHVVGSPEDSQQMRCVYKDRNGQIQTLSLTQLKRLVDSSNAKVRALPGGDVAIYEFTGDSEGVEVSDLEFAPNNKKVAVASGFPKKFATGNESDPLLSVGYAVNPVKGEPSDYVQKLIEQSNLEPVNHLPKILFSGRTMKGNSGGPLIDGLGKVLGICRGPHGSIGRESGMEEFIDFRPVLKLLVSRDAETSSA